MLTDKQTHKVYEVKDQRGIITVTVIVVKVGHDDIKSRQNKDTVIISLYYQVHTLPSYWGDLNWVFPAPIYFATLCITCICRTTTQL